MLRKLLLFVCCLFSFLMVKGQSFFNGKVFENKSHIALAGIRVTNINSKQSTVTDEKGQFRIAANISDMVVFKGFAYKPDTVLVTGFKAREVYLDAQTNQLEQVTVTDTTGRSSTINPTLDHYYDPQYHGQTVVYTRDRKGRLIGGITIRLHYWKGEEHRRKKAAMKARDRAVVEDIDRTFTPVNIAQYVPLKGDDMENFLMLYTPEIAVYTASDFNLLNYLNTYYKTWLTLTPEQRQAGQIFTK